MNRFFSVCLVLSASILGLGSGPAYAQDRCVTIRQGDAQSQTIYKSAFADLKVQILEVCPFGMVAGFSYSEVEPAKSGNFGTCLLVKNSLYVVEKSENSIHLSRSDPRGGSRRQDIFMAIQKRPCGSLDRTEYVWTHGVTEGSFVTIINRLRELRDKSIVEFLKDHGTPGLLHWLETDEIGDLTEEANIAREKNFNWKLESIGVHKPADGISPLFVLNFRGPTRQWQMELDFLAGRPHISSFGWVIN